MKILLVAQWVKLPGFEGAASHHTEFANALVKEGVKVHILVSSCEKEIAGAKVHNAGGKLPRPLLSYASSGRIEKICRDEKIDVIHKRMDPGSGFSVFAAKKAGVPIVAEINFNPFSFEKRGSFLLDVVKPAVQHLPRVMWAKYFLPKADAVVCVSESVVESLARHGVRNAICIPNGVNIEKFRGATEKGEKLKEKLKIEGEVIAIVGGLGPRHGLEGIMKCAKEMEDEFPNARFVIIGGVERYREHVERMKKIAPSNVMFVGKVSEGELPAYLGMADVCLAPFKEAMNKEEPYGFCPIKILQYMGAGKAVVASRLPWIEEILEEGRNAILFGNENGIGEGKMRKWGREVDGRGIGMREAIERLLRDKKLRERMGKENERKANEKYSWRAVAKEYIRVYGKLIKERKE